MPNPLNFTTLKNTAIVSTVAAMTATLMFSCFIVAVVALHFLRTDYNPLHRFISEYEVGAYGIVMRIAFSCLSAGSFALIIALYAGIPRPARSYTAILLLSIWSICVLIAAVFPTDLAGTTETTSGKIHNNASLLGFLSIVLASIFLLRFRKDDKWKPFYKQSLLLSCCLIVAFIAMIATIITQFIYIGLIQRLFVVLVLSWLMITARRVLVTTNTLNDTLL